MKKFFIGLFIFIILIIGVLIAIPYFVDANQFKPTIISTTKRITGRDLTINGDISLSLFPDISLQVADVSFSNMPGVTEPTMAKLTSLELDVALFPLLQGGKLNVNKFVLVDPEINLLITKSGTKNWELDLPKSIEKTETKATAKSDNSAANALNMVRDVTIKNGTFHFDDQQQGKKISLSNVNTTLELSGADNPLTFDGKAVWNGVSTTIALNLDNPEALLNNESSDVDFDASNSLFSASYKGSVSSGEAASGGKLSLNISDVNGLSAWTGGKPVKEGKKHAFELNSNVKLQNKLLQLTDLAMELDSNDINGAITADMTKSIPFIKGQLAAEHIDVGPLMSKEKSEASGGEGDGKSEGWSTNPIDLSGLRSANADITFTAKSFASPKLHLGAIDAAITLQNGILRTTLNNIGFYGGSLQGSVVADGSRNVPAISNNITLTNVSAEPFLKEVAGSNKLSGKLNAAIDTQASGKSQKAMVSSLNGKGRFDLADGKIRGANLFSMVRNVATSFKNPSSTSQETEFTTMKGSFVISSGIVRNNDLLMTAPQLNITGAGTADLPRKYLDYRLVPQIAGGRDVAEGETTPNLTVPVKVAGPFSRLTFAPDVGSALREAIKDPAKAKEQLKSLEDNIKSFGKSFGF